MIHRVTVSKLILGTALLTASMASQACANGNEQAAAIDAVLVNTQDGPTREAIRVFVRAQSGPSLIAVPDSLGQSPVLKYHKRQNRRGSSISRRDFMPSGDFRLVMDGSNRCWLVHSLQDVVTLLNCQKAQLAPPTAVHRLNN